MRDRLLLAVAVAVALTASCGADGGASQDASSGGDGGADDEGNRAGTGTTDQGGGGVNSEPNGSGGVGGEDTVEGGGDSLGGQQEEGGPDGSDAGGAGAGGAGAEEPGKPPTESCAAAEDESRWANGKKLYVGVDSQCGNFAPCFGSIYSATYGGAAKNGDTIVLLPGAHGRDIVDQTKDLSELRITSLDRETTSIEGAGLIVTGKAGSTGQLWIDHLTFRNSGPRTSSVEDGWGIHVTSWANADVRIQDNVFEDHLGNGGLALESSNVNVSFHATVARNVFINNAGDAAALLIDVPDSNKSYCFRVENNLIANNDLGVLVVIGDQGKLPVGIAELVNNTIVGNEVGLTFSSVTNVQSSNNIFFDNQADLPPEVEIGYAAKFRSNLMGGGQFTGVRGNFSADPLFEDAEAGDFRLQPGSPAQARATASLAPDQDIAGVSRGYRPDLGAYERAGHTGTGLTGLSCGDRVVQWGSVETALGTFRGFETCDDGNQTNGDGCSEFCQREATAPQHKLSRFGGSLCVVRQNAHLDCWGDIAKGMPTGSFEQVAVSQYYACALRDGGAVTCWLEGGLLGAFSPSGEFSALSSDGVQTCGVKAGGGIECWNDAKATVSHDGNFAQVATNGRVCGLSALGTATCWDPYVGFPTGQVLQIFPDLYGGCALSPDGLLSCVPNVDFFVDTVPDAGFQRAALDHWDGLGIRPDGRLAHWHLNSVDLPIQDRPFIDAVGSSAGCGLSADDKVYCWGPPGPLPQE
jgi:cysteine-rich repeat protein